MEDDEEIQSQPSAGSGSQSQSPSPSPPNGRITVTVAAVPPPPPQQNTLALTLPLQQSNKPSGGGGREDCWSEGATGVLIDAWGERYLELSRGNLKQKHWKEVADIVSSREDYTKNPKTDIQCKNRIDTVKKKYKVEKAKTAAGAGPSKWIFFEKLDQLIGPTAKIPPLNAITMSSSSKVPVGIPVGLRSSSHHQYLNHQQQQQQQVIKHNVIKNPPKIRFKKRGHVETESEDESEPEPDESPDSADSLPPPPPPPPPPAKRVRPRREVDTERKWGNSVRVLTQAIVRFGEAYEKAESEKLQQVVEMEKQRMKFAKELELQRMQFFMKTQVEISQLKHKRGGGSSGNHHTSNNNINNNNDNNNNNNSDCSN